MNQNENEQLSDVKKELYAKFDKLERNYSNLKRTICILFNLLIPGLGFLIYGKELIKGLITFVLFYGYIILHITYIAPLTDLAIAVFYLLPALIIWITSAIMVGNIDK